jgi:hypothetical protein
MPRFAPVCGLLSVLPVILFECGCSGCNVVLTNVVTQHNNNNRNGVYPIENDLNPTNVESDFGLLYTRDVEGAVYSQPLYIHGVPTRAGTVLVYGLTTAGGKKKKLERPPALADGAAILGIFKRYGAEHGPLGTPQGDAKRLEDGSWSREFKSRLPLRGYTVVSVHPNPAALEISCSHPIPPSAYTDVESSVYWNQRTGAHVVTGEIRAFWLKQKGPQGPLGYPISDEVPSPDGSGRASRFEGGEVIWHFDKGPSVANQR